MKKKNSDGPIYSYGTMQATSMTNEGKCGRTNDDGTGGDAVIGEHDDNDYGIIKRSSNTR